MRDGLLPVAANSAADARPSAEFPFAEPPTTDQRLTEKDIVGLKYFDQLLPLFQRLHHDGCERDKAGNRDLHFDQYCLMVLVFLFNPVCSSLRALQQASELKNVQKKLGCSRAALGSLSEAATVFDPERLVGIIQELSGRLPSRGTTAQDQRLKDIPGTLTLVDATLITAMPRIMEASVRKRRGESGTVKWRLHTHFEVDRHVPSRIDVTPNGGGEHDERAVLNKTIASDRLYVMDRGYAKFKLFNDIVAAKSGYVCRLRDNSVYEVVEDRPLTEADRAANVLSDQIVRFGKSGNKATDQPNHTLRLVLVKIRPHVSKRKRCSLEGKTGAAPPASTATASCGSPPTCSMSPPRSSRSCTPTAGPSRSFINRPRRLPPVQAPAGLPSSAEPQPERHRDPGLLRDHRLPGAGPLDRPPADQAHARDALLPQAGLGHDGRSGSACGEAETHRRPGREKTLIPPPRSIATRAIRAASRCALHNPQPLFPPPSHRFARRRARAPTNHRDSTARDRR